MLLMVNLISPNGTHDGRFLQNYGDIHITDSLARIPGVASVMNFGLRKYAMRIWLDPAKLTNLGLTAVDVRNAVKEQNQQAAAGKIGQAPAPKGQAFQFQLLKRWKTPWWVFCKRKNRQGSYLKASYNTSFRWIFP